MSFLKIMIALDSIGIFYYMVCIQVWMGFPPFYRKLGSASENDIKKFVLLIVLMASALLVLLVPEPKLYPGAFGLICIWLGLSARSWLRSQTTGPRPWLCCSVTVRWPMLLFDFWSLGISAFVLLHILAN